MILFGLISPFRLPYTHTRFCTSLIPSYDAHGETRTNERVNATGHASLPRWRIKHSRDVHSTYLRCWIVFACGNRSRSWARLSKSRRNLSRLPLLLTQPADIHDTSNMRSVLQSYSIFIVIVLRLPSSTNAHMLTTSQERPDSQAFLNDALKYSRNIHPASSVSAMMDCILYSRQPVCAWISKTFEFRGNFLFLVSSRVVVADTSSSFTLSVYT